MFRAYGTPQYVTSIKFAYLETWGYNVSDDYLEMVRLRTAPVNEGRPMTAEERVRSKALQATVLRYNNIFEDGNMSSGAVKKSTLASYHPQALRLMEILAIEVAEVNLWMCMPVYRDAIVFYNEEQEVVSVLNICFSCDSVWATTHPNMEADEKTYQQLKLLLNELGHYTDFLG